MKLSLVTNIFVMIILASCSHQPKTIDSDTSISNKEINGYKYHIKEFGNPKNPTIIVVHGGPGGDFNYLLPLRNLADNFHLVFYDQRGTGLSPRVKLEELTIEQYIQDLDDIIKTYNHKGKVSLIGHSWGGILAIGYIGKYPNKVSHAVIAEPGMLNQDTAKVFVKELKNYQSFGDTLFLLRKMIQAPFVRSFDGHESFDFVMTEMLNRNKPGKPYQCEDKALPPNLFIRGGFESFNQLLKPVFDDPSSLKHDFAKNIKNFKEKVLFISSSCSFIGYSFQEKYHLSLMPKQTQHIKAPEMGHNFFTTHPEWSKNKILSFLSN